MFVRLHLFCLILCSACVVTSSRRYGMTYEPTPSDQELLIYESTADLPPERGEWIKLGFVRTENQFWASEEALMEQLMAEARLLGAEAIILPSQVGVEIGRSIQRRTEPLNGPDPAVMRARVDEQIFETETIYGIERRPWRGHVSAIQALAIKWTSFSAETPVSHD